MKFIPLCFVLLLFACKKNKEPGIIPLSSTSVTLLAGSVTEVTITGPDKTYKVSSGNESVAYAAVAGNLISISTFTPGSTVIRVSDDAGVTAEIKVHARTVAGTWRKVQDPTRYKTYVNVEGGNNIFASELRQQILTDLAKPQNNTFGLAFGGSPQFLFREIFQDNSIKEGSYTYDKLTLKMTRNGNTETYQLTMRGSNILQLLQDKTAEYKALHPDKSLTRVEVIRFLQEYQPPG